MAWKHTRPQHLQRILSPGQVLVGPWVFNFSVSEQNILTLFPCLMAVWGSPSIFFRNFPLSFLQPQDARDWGHPCLLGPSLSGEHFLACSRHAAVFNNRKEMAHSKQIPTCPWQAVWLLSFFVSSSPWKLCQSRLGTELAPYQLALSLRWPLCLITTGLEERQG